MNTQPAPNEIADARKRAGLSQAAAASLVHLGSKSRWYEYESGYRPIDPARWELFLLKTDQHPDWQAAPKVSIDTGAVERLADQPMPLLPTKDPEQYAAWLRLDTDGRVSATVEPRSNIDERRTDPVGWRIPLTVSGQALADFVQRPHVRELLQRIHRGRCSVRIGITRVPTLTDDATEAYDTIAELVASELEQGCPEAMSVYSYTAHSRLSDLWPKSLTLQEAAEALQAQAREDGIVLIGDVEDTILLRTVRTYQDAPELLEPHQAKEMLRIGALSPMEYKELIENLWS